MIRDRFIIAREYVVSLFPVFQLADSFGHSIKRVIGVNVEELAGKLEGHSIWWIASESGWRQGHKAVVNKIQKNPSWFAKVLNEIEYQGKSLGLLSQRMSKVNLGSLTDKKLYEYYLNFCKSNTIEYDFGLVCSLLDYQDTTFLTDSVNKILSNRKIAKGKINEFFTLLTFSTRLWPDKEQELKLSLIYKQIVVDRFLKKILLTKNSELFLKKLLQINPVVYRLLNRHAKKYGYLTYVYEGPAVGLDFYVDIMKDWLNKGLKSIDIKNKQVKERKLLMADQKKLLTKLNLSKSELILINFARRVSFIKPYRRLLQSQAYYNFEPVLLEIARRLNLSLRQVRYLLPQEVKNSLNNKQAPVNLLNDRIKYCVYINNRGQKKLLTGQAAKKFWQTVRPEKKYSTVKEIKGSTAYPGQVSGKVVVVNMPDDMVKMKAGDILVSSATSPNLMPAIRKAAAIVTDEGGITCHAAIVSRELKIPCLIGTKIATKILRDGSKVLVDATGGILYKK